MKPKSILLAILTTLATTYGQLPPNAPRQPQFPPTAPRQTSPQPTENTPATLDANFSIKISGGLGDSKPTDVILSGNGPQFEVSLIEPVRHISIIVNQKDSIYTVGYRIGAMLPVTSGNNIQYSDSVITGTYYATLGQPFNVLQVGDKTLSIQIDKTKANK